MPPRQIERLPIGQVFPNPSQPRKLFEPIALEELGRSIQTQGLMQPITVTPRAGRFMIVAGERRYRAHLLIGAKTIEAQIEDDLSDDVVMVKAIMENFLRRDMNPLEEARGFQALISTGYDVPRIVKELGLKSPSIVRQRLDLLELQPEIAKLVESGQLSIAMGWAVAQVPQAFQSRMMRDIQLGKYKTTDQVKQAAWALRDATTQIDAFGDAPQASKTDIAACGRLEGKIEDICAMVQAGFKDGECIAAQRVSPDRVRLMADRLTLIRKHILQMEHDLRRVASQTELSLEVA